MLISTRFSEFYYFNGNIKWKRILSGIIYYQSQNVRYFAPHNSSETTLLQK